MHVRNLRMFNCHRSNEYDSLWVPGNTFIIDGTERTFYNRNTKHPGGSIDQILKNIYSGYDCIEFEDYSPEYREAYMKRIEESVFYWEHLIRELALEEARLRYAPHKPSRYTSIWLTKEDALEFWSKAIRNSEVYELSVTGKLFRSNSDLLPKVSDARRYEDIIKVCKRYWHPGLKLYSLEKKREEYLFQGEVKVLGKVK